MVITGLTRNQLGSNPPRVRISPSPPLKYRCTFVYLFFYIMRDSKRAMRSIETVRRTVSVPGCVPPNAKVRRANLAVSAIKKQVHFCVPVFLYNARFEKGNASIETVQWTVSVPGCVPPNAKVRRANLAVSAIKKQVHFCVPVFLYNARLEIVCRIFIISIILPYPMLPALQGAKVF